MDPIEEKNYFLRIIKKNLDKVNESLEIFRQRKYELQRVDKKQFLELETIFIELNDALLKLNDAAENLHSEFSSAVYKINRFQRLSKKEFYLLASEKIIKWTDLNGFDNFQLFDFHFYEDDKTRSYIIPTNTPDTGGWGIAPEHVKLKHLRPEQKEFFAKYDPKTYKRFKK